MPLDRHVNLVDENGQPINSGNPLPTTTGGGPGGGAVTVADGADVNAGSTTDAAITSDTNGTLSGKLRGLVKIFASVWDSGNGRLKVDGSAVTQPTSVADGLDVALGAKADSAASSDTGTFSLIALFKRLLDKLTTGIIGYQSGVLIEATLTRPANTTAYAANDEMTDTGGSIRTLTNIARTSGGSGTITRITCSVSTNATEKPQFRLWIYDTTLTPGTDNTAFTHTDGQQDTLVGYLDLLSFAVGDTTGSTGNFSMDSGKIAIPYKTSGSANLFLRVQVLNGYTAGANSDTYKFRCYATQN